DNGLTLAKKAAESAQSLASKFEAESLGKILWEGLSFPFRHQKMAGPGMLTRINIWRLNRQIRSVAKDIAAFDAEQERLAGMTEVERARLEKNRVSIQENGAALTRKVIESTESLARKFGAESLWQILSFPFRSQKTEGSGILARLQVWRLNRLMHSVARDINTFDAEQDRLAGLTATERARLEKNRVSGNELAVARGILLLSGIVAAGALAKATAADASRQDLFPYIAVEIVLFVIARLAEKHFQGMHDGADRKPDEAMENEKTGVPDQAVEKGYGRISIRDWRSLRYASFRPE
nr:hypothetical protein [Pseudomonadota bacterium]